MSSKLSAARDTGVQSYCFRHFKDNVVVAEKVKAIGLSKIEICAVHADFDKPETMEGILATYKKAGVEIVSMGVETFKGEGQRDRNRFECAKKLGVKYISAHFTIDTFHVAVPAVMKLSDEFGVKIAIHCHGGYMFGGSADVLEHLLKISGPQIGLNIDTAWCMQTGRGNPVEWIKKFAPRVYGMHYKDFVFDQAAKWKDVVIGTGNLDLPGVVKALEETSFSGFTVIEYEGDIEKPEPALKECVEKIRALK